MVANKSNGERFIKTTSGILIVTFCLMGEHFLTLIAALMNTSEIIGSTGTTWQSLATVLPSRRSETINQVMMILMVWMKDRKTGEEVLESRRLRTGP